MSQAQNKVRLISEQKNPAISIDIHYPIPNMNIWPSGVTSPTPHYAGATADGAGGWGAWVGVGWGRDPLWVHPHIAYRLLITCTYKQLIAFLAVM